MGGDGAVPALLRLLRGDAPPQRQLSPLQQQEVRTNAAYALGIAAEHATAGAVDALAEALDESSAALDERVAGLPASERGELEASFDRGARGASGRALTRARCRRAWCAGVIERLTRACWRCIRT